MPVPFLLLCVLFASGRAEDAAFQSDILHQAIDFHCHTAPDVVPRLLDDVELARIARSSGMRAVVLKNHYTLTSDRAFAAMQIVPGIQVFGGIVLNRSVGGLNVEAVRRMIEMEGGRGRIVWLPTRDAENEVKKRALPCHLYQ